MGTSHATHGGLSPSLWLLHIYTMLTHQQTYRRLVSSRAKESYPDALPCPLCGEPDSQYHLICGCPHPIVDKARTDILTTLTARMNRFDPYSPEYKCMYAIRTLASPDSPVGSPHYIWTGTWCPSQIEHLRQALLDVPCTDWTTSSSLLCVINVTCTALADGAREAVGLRFAHIVAPNAAIGAQ